MFSYKQTDDAGAQQLRRLGLLLCELCTCERPSVKDCVTSVTLRVATS